MTFITELTCRSFYHEDVNINKEDAMSNFQATKQQTEMLDKYTRKTDRAVVSRALMVILVGAFAGMLLGNIAFGMVFAVTFLAWYFISRIYKETRYSLDHPRG